MSDFDKNPEARKLDGEVHIKLGNSEWDTYRLNYWEENGEEKVEYLSGYTNGDIPHYSTDITAALPLITDKEMALIQLDNTHWFCGKILTLSWSGFSFEQGTGTMTGRFGNYYIGTTAPHAICLAFLALPGQE